MPPIGKIRPEIVEENGLKIPSFVIETNSFNEIFNVFNCYYLSPIPINLEKLKENKLVFMEKRPDDSIIRFELCHEDPFPENAYESYLNLNEINQLKEANDSSKMLRIYLEGKNGIFGKPQKALLQELYPFYLDWDGIIGFLYIKRLNNNLNINEHIEILENYLNNVGYKSNLLTELGYLYKLNNNINKAIECYTNEIKYMISDDGIFCKACFKAINNLGIAYKNNSEHEKAFTALKTVLLLYPNHFEANINIIPYLQDKDEIMKHYCRAYIIRHRDPLFNTLYYKLINKFSISETEMNDLINSGMRQTDLSNPFANFDRIDIMNMLKLK